jgi:RNA polymerase sigma-70 factor (ECF subfamily)
MHEPEDSILVERSLNGDGDAFAELVRRYQAKVSRTVYRTLGNRNETEDAVQEVFLRAFLSLRKFKLTHAFGPWIFRIATNYCIDQLRRRKVRKYELWGDLRGREEGRLMRDLSRNGDFESVLLKEPEQYEQVAQALIDDLKPEYKIAFVLRELEKMSYGEIARILQISQLAVRVRVSRARAEIRRKIHEHIGKNIH